MVPGISTRFLVGGLLEKNRTRLRSVAYRMLGSLTEADDAPFRTPGYGAVPGRSRRRGVNMDGWLTTIVARVCLGKLRSRTVRREIPVGAHVPDPVINPARRGRIPRTRCCCPTRSGLALQVVLETLGPRRAPGLRPARHVRSCPSKRSHRWWGYSGGGKAARQQGPAPGAGRPRPGPRARAIARQREVVDAFFAAAHLGDPLDALVAVLDPDVVVRTDGERGVRTLRRSSREQQPSPVGTVTMAQASAPKRPVLVNGAAGVIITMDGQPRTVMGFSISGGRISEINAIVDPERLRQIDLAVLGD